MITVQNMSYGYTRKKQILHNISFSLMPGITLLIGENGSGKSTLMKLITASIPASCDIQIDGEKTTDLQRKQKMAYLPQEFDIYPSLRVNELLAFVAAARGVSKKDLSTVVDEAAKRVNIDSVLRQKVRACSVGTKRRIGIAATLLGNPDIVLLDEPTAGIDPKERSKFYHMIKECYLDKTVLIATHILDEVEMIADRVIMLSDGCISYDGPYFAFRHSLDGRVFQITCADDQTCDAKIKANMQVLSETYAPEGKNYHVLLHEISAPPNWKPVTPTLEDLWEFYRRDTSNV